MRFNRGVTNALRLLYTIEKSKFKNIEILNHGNASFNFASPSFLLIMAGDAI